MKEKRIGILGAMPEEINGVVSLLKDKKEIVKGMRTYYTGTINNVEAVVVFSRWGKVASATTVTHLIVEFGITELIFTGVAGAISKDLNIGDIVIANSLVQHDLDARPIMKRFEIPLLGITELYPPKEVLDNTIVRIGELVENGNLINLLSLIQQEKFSLTSQKVMIGKIASGDQFFSSNLEKENILAVLPDVLCVEMEGAAVAQVCFEYGIPFVIIRTISDAANENSVIDFNEFISQVASKFGLEIIKKLTK
ncbi:5'-methylthioadenosine/adenosylhomocysteine nucleosidase [Flavobacterium aquicola]|uniref:Adenosylhomocysteine nucleosidase n=1 Tax=Flavobacterium aquicola TaxID=1682742 RepID=A0A3E0EPP0_9FLAO|nr:5'-methylthioadenosine/adenosylhomocysteine nucleosidase [Flavobacterium aquicola]REH00188.1 adenosylhomocysteine nucleosidase [Flavobacterium aquicola]